VCATVAQFRGTSALLRVGLLADGWALKSGLAFFGATMTLDELNRAHDLSRKIAQIEREIAAFREHTEDVTVTIGDKKTNIFGTVPRVSLAIPAAQIGDQIVSVLEQRLAGWRGELAELGISE